MYNTRTYENIRKLWFCITLEYLKYVTIPASRKNIQMQLIDISNIKYLIA